MHGDANRSRAASVVIRNGVGGPRCSWPRTSRPYLWRARSWITGLLPAFTPLAIGRNALFVPPDCFGHVDALPWPLLWFPQCSQWGAKFGHVRKMLRSGGSNMRYLVSSLPLRREEKMLKRRKVNITQDPSQRSTKASQCGSDLVNQLNQALFSKMFFFSFPGKLLLKHNLHWLF